eukprot:scaffold27398_cov86-Isochrysis_galbana.AAC.1
MGSKGGRSGEGDDLRSVCGGEGVRVGDSGLNHLTRDSGGGWVGVLRVENRVRPCRKLLAKKRGVGLACGHREREPGRCPRGEVHIGAALATLVVWRGA